MEISEKLTNPACYIYSDPDKGAVNDLYKQANRAIESTVTSIDVVN